MERPRVRSQTGIVLNPIAAVHTDHADIVHPRDAELNVAFGFEELFRDESVFGIAVEERGESVHDGLDV